MLSNKKVLIIGGSSGFGLEIVRQCLEKSAEVYLTGRDIQKLERINTELHNEFKNADLTVIQFDNHQPNAYPSLLEKLPNVDYIVSMLGGAMAGGFLQNSVESIRKAIEDKFFDNLVLAQNLYQNINPNGGLIFTAGSGGHPSNASGAIVGNHAISDLVRGLAMELAPSIRVNAVAPTWTPTGLWRNLSEIELERQTQTVAQSNPLGRVAQLKEVASAYLFLMENGYVTGQVLSVDGGISA